ncbi:hypothetical protein Cs7R123_37650 [Catellatospora sp. TT07R-123]|uniref:hypothetical protein n=1 Tax=Catellatospora sp. TT07R-123 TaxID=2733863 RepID=UPI001B0F14CB|nr:hypothetical protein [Catellatospora sp. TT07R-123]GHJ46423.1 hypothetical protein Cs7R123_37650 [Catellatospora sp. TT07R-123]
MEPRRAPTVAYVVVTAILLAAGAFWWHRSAPAEVAPVAAPSSSSSPLAPQLEEALRSLPDLIVQGPSMGSAEVFQPSVLDVDVPFQRDLVLNGGPHELRLSCVAEAAQGTVHVAFAGPGVQLPEAVVPCADGLGWQQQTLLVPDLQRPLEVTTTVHGVAAAVVGWAIIPRVLTAAPETWHDRVLSQLPGQKGRPSADFRLTAGEQVRHRFETPATRQGLRIVCAGNTVVRVTVTGENQQQLEMFCDAAEQYMLEFVGGATGGTVVFEALGDSGSAYVRAVVGDPIATY